MLKNFLNPNRVSLQKKSQLNMLNTRDYTLKKVFICVWIARIKWIMFSKVGEIFTTWTKKRKASSLKENKQKKINPFFSAFSQ